MKNELTNLTKSGYSVGVVKLQLPLIKILTNKKEKKKNENR